MSPIELKPVAVRSLLSCGHAKRDCMFLRRAEPPRHVSPLRSHEVVGVLGAKYVMVQVCNPLPARDSHIEVRDGFGQVLGNAIPIELWVTLHKVRRRSVAQLPVHSDL